MVRSTCNATKQHHRLSDNVVIVAAGDSGGSWEVDNSASNEQTLLVIDTDDEAAPKSASHLSWSNTSPHRRPGSPLHTSQHTARTTNTTHLVLTVKKPDHATQCQHCGNALNLPQTGARRATSTSSRKRQGDLPTNRRAVCVPFS